MNIQKILITIFLLVTLAVNSYSQWTKIVSAPSQMYDDIFEAGGNLYLGSYGSGIYRSIDGTLTWQQINNGLNTFEALVIYQILISGSNMYAATIDGIYKSTNSGANWVKKSNGIIVGGGATYAFTLSIFEFSGNLFTGSWTGIYRSTNNAENWLATNISGSSVSAINFTYHNGILFAAREAGTNPVGFKSSDNGVTWSTITSFNLPMITFFSEGMNLWAGTIDGVWLSTNDGLSWQMRNNGLTSDPYSSCIIRVGGTLVTSLKFGGSGIYRSSNDGLNWENIGTGLPFLNSIEKLIVYNSKMLAATSNGLWQRNISEIVVGVESQGASLPQAYKLYQNYPNPFNPRTVISYELRVTSFVSLNIFDISGKHITNLVNKKEDAGNYSIDFSGEGLPSGIYIYRLTAGDFTETKKMILLK